MLTTTTAAPLAPRILFWYRHSLPIFIAISCTPTLPHTIFLLSSAFSRSVNSMLRATLVISKINWLPMMQRQVLRAWLADSAAALESIQEVRVFWGTEKINGMDRAGQKRQWGEEVGRCGGVILSRPVRVHQWGYQSTMMMILLCFSVLNSGFGSGQNPDEYNSNESVMGVYKLDDESCGGECPWRV